MKYIALLTMILFVVSCDRNIKKDLNGIWIPEKIDWKQGNFETIYIYNDTSFVKIASTNALLKNDSIAFSTDEGFIFSSGNVKNLNGEQVKLSYRIWYKFIKMNHEKLPGKLIIDTVNIMTNDNHTLLLKYHNEDYLRTNKFTKNSKRQLLNIAADFLELIKKDSTISKPNGD
ncbi:MAG: hypothetical protein JWQ66_3951 [Mucilaginibacter sp.]|nr:hypothetical protein [Mucilaginibacter sp.]